MAARSAFAQWRGEKRAWLMTLMANRLFRKGDAGLSEFLRRRMAPPQPDAPLDPELEHPDFEPPDVNASGS